jgi:hypothetical protein
VWMFAKRTPLTTAGATDGARSWCVYARFS